MVQINSKNVNVKCFFDRELANELVEKSAMKGLKKLAETILTDAKKLCPVDSGTLRQSGEVKASNKNKTVEISFNTPYALKQHEEMGYNHPKGGQAKYLEQPFNEKIKDAQSTVEFEIGKALYKEKAKKWGY